MVAVLLTTTTTRRRQRGAVVTTKISACTGSGRLTRHRRCCAVSSRRKQPSGHGRHHPPLPPGPSWSPSGQGGGSTTIWSWPLWLRVSCPLSFVFSFSATSGFFSFSSQYFTKHSHR